MINRESGTPVYLQIAYNIRKKIVDNYYKKDDKIPTEDDLATLYGVSRMTARNAVTHLVDEGYVYRIHGKGAFVLNSKLNRNLNKLNNFYQDIEKLGLSPSAKVIDFIERLPNQKEQNVLSIQRTEKVYDVKRIRYVDKAPLGLQNFIVPKKLVPNLPNIDIETESFYEYLEEVGYPLYKADQKMESIYAPDIAEKIGVSLENNPFFFFERISYTKDNTPVELLYSYFHGENYSFNITLYSDS